MADLWGPLTILLAMGAVVGALARNLDIDTIIELTAAAVVVVLG